MSEVSSGVSYRRRLSVIEEEEFVRPPQMNGAAVAILRGELDVAALTIAFEALRCEYPELSGRAEQVGEGFDLVIDEVRKPAAAFVRVSQYDDLVTSSLNTAETLSALDVVTHEDRHVVRLWFNHAVADGSRVIYLFQQFWSRYTRLTESGSVGEIEPRPVPKSPQEVFNERGILKGLSDGSERLADVRWHGSWPTTDELPAGELRFSSKRLRIAPELFTKLRKVARKRGCSFHTIIVGAVAVAERSAFTDLPEHEAVPLGFGSFVDLRAVLSPPVEPAEVTNFMTVAYARLLVSGDSDPMEVGQAAVQQLVDDVVSGFLQQVPLHPPSVAFGEPWVSINNLKKVPTIELSTGLVLEDLDLRFEKDVNQFRDFVAALSQEARRPSMPVSMYFAGAFADELIIQAMDFPGFVSQQVRDRILDRLVEVFEDIAQSAEV